jgi:hypothetical protein
VIQQRSVMRGRRAKGEFLTTAHPGKSKGGNCPLTSQSTVLKPTTTFPRWVIRLRVLWISLVLAAFIVPYLAGGYPRYRGHLRLYILPNGHVFRPDALYSLDAPYLLREFSQYKVASPASGETVIRVPVVMLWRNTETRESFWTDHTDSRVVSETIYVSTLVAAMVEGDLESIELSDLRRAQPIPPLRWYPSGAGAS